MRGHQAEDLTGKKFGKLVVIGRAPNLPSRPREPRWYCQCDCGSSVKIVRGGHLRSGAIISCGCVGKKRLADSHTKHGGCRDRLYGVWYNMKTRCYNTNVRSYKDYGARGIRVCDEWLHDYGAFKAWAYGHGYNPSANYGECTLDRIDVDGDYCPSNCHWVDMKTQANNRRNSPRETAVMTAVGTERPPIVGSMTPQEGYEKQFRRNENA